MFGVVGEGVEFVLGGDVPLQPLALHQVAARAIFVYALGILVVRLGKGRLLARFTGVDLLMGFILGSLLSRGITGNGSLAGTAVASVALVAMHWLLTWAASRSHTIGGWIKGHAYEVARDGQMLTDSLRRAHLSAEDLKGELRLKGNTERIEEVAAAFKERNGEVSVVKKRAEPKVLEVRLEDSVAVVRIELATPN